MANYFPTGEQMRAIAAEVADFHATSQFSAMWTIRYIEVLTGIEQECYLVEYTSGVAIVFVRDTRGKLMPSGTWTYEASENFEDTHPSSSKQASAPESGVLDG